MKVDKIYTASLRREYLAQPLRKSDVTSNPFKQFERWFEEAINAQVLDPNAMTLATATKDGKPSCRIVLLKGFDKNGFIFYTNYKSRKAKELSENPYAALSFYWSEINRQVRIRGKVSKVSAKESEKYFHSRPKDSQIGALASPQSDIIKNRNMLEQEFAKLAKKYEKAKAPRSKHWGGYILKPLEFEFWQGRPSRLHDRVLYTRKKNKRWEIERLAP